MAGPVHLLKGPGVRELDEEWFSTEVDKIVSALIDAKAMDEAAIRKLLNYYESLFQCARAVRTKRQMIVLMKQSFQDVSKLISISIDRLEKRLKPAEFNEIRDRSNALIKCLSDQFVFEGTK